MANLYGVSNPVIAPVYFTTLGGASVTVNSGVETVVATSPALAAISAGVYYPMIVGAVMSYQPAGALTGLSVSARIGAGADFVTQAFQATPFANLAAPMVPICLVGPNSTVPWQGAGSTISITLLPTSANCQAV